MLVKSISYLASYAPVFALLGVQAHQIWWKSILWGLCLLGLIGLFSILKLANGKSTQRITITSKRDAGAETAGFLAGYLLPVITADIDSAYIAWATAIYLVVAWIITIRSSLLQVNPVLFLFGFRIFSIEGISEGGSQETPLSKFVISKIPIRVGDTVNIHHISEDVFKLKDLAKD